MLKINKTELLIIQIFNTSLEFSQTVTQKILRAQQKNFNFFPISIQKIETCPYKMDS